MYISENTFGVIICLTFFAALFFGIAVGKRRT